jgi:hypothetical protein
VLSTLGNAIATTRLQMVAEPPDGLTGRWYPAAMMMAKRPILVVGGKNGSNGAPVPNLEIVPKRPDAALVYDWLNRTDPTISILDNSAFRRYLCRISQRGESSGHSKPQV